MLLYIEPACYLYIEPACYLYIEPACYLYIEPACYLYIVLGSLKQCSTRHCSSTQDLIYIYTIMYNIIPMHLV